MKVGLVTTHSFPIPTPTHTGDIVILDLAHGLTELGHEVTMYAPAGTAWPRLCPMPASFGKATPSAGDCEDECLSRHAGSLVQQDIVHDFSITKRIAEHLARAGRPTISTLLGGQWMHPDPPQNIVVWSNAMRSRGLRGATDYEGTPLEAMGGPPQRPIRDAHVVYGGIDTDWYTPGTEHEDFFLWMNRWHPAKGYAQAIALARRTGIRLVMAGEHPDNELFEYQRDCAREAERLAAGAGNIEFRWLPPDPDHHTAKRELYRRAKALLYTVQFQEPFGLSQAEALACGTPVIGNAYGSVPEVITRGVTGYVCSGDMKTAVESVDAIQRTACREEAVRRFDRRVMAANYVREYQAILDGKGWG